MNWVEPELLNDRAEVSAPTTIVRSGLEELSLAFHESTQERGEVLRLVLVPSGGDLLLHVILDVLVEALDPRRTMEHPVRQDPVHHQHHGMDLRFVLHEFGVFMDVKEVIFPQHTTVVLEWSELRSGHHDSTCFLVERLLALPVAEDVMHLLVHDHESIAGNPSYGRERPVLDVMELGVPHEEGSKLLRPVGSEDQLVFLQVSGELLATNFPKPRHGITSPSAFTWTAICGPCSEDGGMDQL